MNSEDVKKLKVALVHDFLTIQGGAERVLKVFHEMWPEAPVYTVTYFPEAFDPPLANWDIRTSFVSRLPFRKRLENQYKLFYQLAIGRFKLSDYDLVLSSTFAGYAKGVVVPLEIKHFSYVHNIPRFLWGLPTATHERLNFMYKKVILPPLEHFWRIWDRQTAERPDELIANSETVKLRVRKFYKRDSTVIYPPVSVEELLREEPASEDYFVYFGRLEQYKNVDIAIKACVRTKNRLKIIGGGSYKSELEKLVDNLNAQGLIEFLGAVSDSERNSVVSKAKAFVFPCPDEDFGIVPVEAMAAGTPVIAFKSGGVTETVVDGETGVLVDDFSVDALVETLKNFNASDFDSEKCREQAKKFSKEVFKDNIFRFIAKNYASS